MLRSEIIILLIGAAVTNVFGNPLTPTNHSLDVLNTISQSNMTLLGQIGNKIFFRSVQQGSGMSVTYFCSESGLLTGKIENMDELNFIQSKSPETAMWLGGKLKGQESYNTSGIAFEWNDHSPIAGDVNFLHESWSWLCLFFQTHVIYSGLCLNDRIMPALCELVV